MKQDTGAEPETLLQGVRINQVVVKTRLVVRHTNFAWWQALVQRCRGERTFTNLSPAQEPTSTQEFWVGRPLDRKRPLISGGIKL
jgi:hypothetical protein